MQAQARLGLDHPQVPGQRDGLGALLRVGQRLRDLEARLHRRHQGQEAGRHPRWGRAAKDGLQRGVI